MDYAISEFLKLQVEVLDTMNIPHLPTALMKHCVQKGGRKQQEHHLTFCALLKFSS